MELTALIPPQYFKKMEEIWLPIENWEDEYLISNHGRIFSQERTDPLERKIGGRHLLASGHPQKIPKVLLCTGKIRQSKKIHRLVAEHFLKREPGRDEVLHLDLDFQNNHVNNLMWASRSEIRQYHWALGMIEVSDKQRNWAGKLGKIYWRKCVDEKSIPVKINGKLYLSIREASRKLGISREKVVAMCR